MSSTNEDTEAALGAFYDECLAPAGAAMAERGARFFELHPDASVESYYTKRSLTGMELYELPTDGLVGSLKEQWANEPELAKAAERLVAMARSFQEDEETSAEVSPYIYQMF